MAKRLLLCAAVWIMPLISSTTVTALGEMKPVSGNWCWISKTRPDLRYGLAHGWRFLVIFLTICIYVYIYQYLGRHFRSLAMSTLFGKDDNLLDGTESSGRTAMKSSKQGFHDQILLGPYNSGDHDPISCREQMSNQLVDFGPAKAPGPKPILFEYADESQNPTSPHPISQKGRSPSNTKPTKSYQTGQRNRQTDSVENEIKRMLLLNGYPIMYILLWIPGLTNRAMEASGKTSSSKILAALQCSTQFVGFANAITYGLNREMRQTLWRDLRN